MGGYKPDGWHSITPRLVVADVPGLVEFLGRAFAAKGELRDGGPTELAIGDSMIMVSEAGPRDATHAILYLYVPDADATCAAALAAGATSVEAPVDTHYGDRRAVVRDPAGNLWQIATRTR